jgi:hypothetical protein
VSHDVRHYARQTTVRLIVGGLILLFVVGDGLIYLFYGQNAAISGLLCLGVGMVPLILIFAAFWIMDWIVKRANKD